MSSALRHALVEANVLMVFYFAALNIFYTVLLAAGWREIRDFVARRPLRDYEAVGTSPLSTPVSLLVPAYNEEPCVVESVRSLLGTRYPELEVVVVNDGSKDATLERLRDAFQLVKVERVPRSALPCKPVRGVYASRVEPRLTVVDKENGGKADSLNAALRYARYPLVCAMDSDTMLDDDALARLVWPFQSDPATVAVGGIVRIANGCTIEHGAVTDVRAPRQLLPCLQVVEYLRAFLCGRTGWSRLGMLLIISGAFGLFHRESVIAAGGYSTDTVGEDAELVVRIHRHCREQGRPYSVSFLADPVCWTEAPSSWRVLGRQRDRWQRGLAETLWRHRRMLLNPRYGRVGLVAMPYFALFELAGPVVEVLGWAIFVASLSLGLVSAPIAAAFLALSCAYGLILSVGALVLEEHAFRRYRRWSCLGRLAACALVESFGYRQWHSLLRVRAFWTLARGKHSWGEMTRAGFGGAQPAPPPPA